MSTIESRITDEERAEAIRHDQLYRKQRGQLRMLPKHWLRFDSPADPLNAYVASIYALGDIRGCRVLDAGCGTGWQSVILARRGGTVDGFDISAEATRIATERASINDVADRCRFSIASFYQLPYPDNTFDRVIGQAVLHHVGHKAPAIAELYRVMKPGALAVFTEPFGNSMLLERIRRLIPVASAAEDDPDQWKHQFRYRDLEDFRRTFTVSVEEFQLLSRLDRITSSHRAIQALGTMDRWLLEHIPFFRRYARSILIRLVKPH